VPTTATTRETLIEETLGVMRLALGRALGGPTPGGKDGFPLIQHFALHFIMDSHGVTQTELATLLGVSPGYVTALVDRLEADHLVHRRRDHEDRRKVRLRISLRGIAFHHHLHREHAHFVLPLFDGWSDAEIESFQAMLRKLVPPVADPGPEPVPAAAAVPVRRPSRFGRHLGRTE
jgi:DNA-binding MarR family transcriptional regulator